jgi:hypothetical protein
MGQAIWKFQCVGAKNGCRGLIEHESAYIVSGACKSCGCMRHILSSMTTSLPFGMALKNARFGSYKQSAKERGLVFELPFDLFHTLILNDCHYCGSAPLTFNAIEHCLYPDQKGIWLNGIDRKDNSLGYTIANSVSCCKICNLAKRNLPYEEFCAYLDRVTKHRCKCCNNNQINEPCSDSTSSSRAQLQPHSA